MSPSPAERQRAYRERKAAEEGRRLGTPGRPRSAQHGSPSRYRSGCRCRKCSKAHAADVAVWRSSRRSD